MVERKRRKKNKQRAERTHGKGDTKNNRGGGCRGGRGNAGATKGKFASIGRLAERKYRLKAKRKGKEITIGQLNEVLDKLVDKGKVMKEKENYIVDAKSGYAKVLSQGNIDKKITLKINASANAIKKINEAGGSFEYAKKSPEEEKEIVSNEETVEVATKEEKVE